jgi:hypothetical protein
MQTTKHCSKCKEDKVLDHFYKNLDSRDGLHPWCKTCSKAARKRRYDNKAHVVLAREIKQADDIAKTIEKHCTKCKTLKPISEYSRYMSRSRGERIRSSCKVCEEARAEKYRNANRVALNSRDRRRKQKAFELGGEALLKQVLSGRTGHFRRESIEHGLPMPNINTAYLVQLYHDQDGKCYYTGQPLRFGRRLGVQQADSMSVDKKDPALGYVKDNLVLCTLESNICKGRKTVEEFKTYIKAILDHLEHPEREVASESLDGQYRWNRSVGSQIPTS